MAGKKRKITRRKVRPLNLKCPFCESEKAPDYKEFKELEAFISDRARIYGRDRSGVCARHQRKLSMAIKRARHLGLLPYAPRV
jgi:small subunit ribosomal protein S18